MCSTIITDIYTYTMKYKDISLQYHVFRNKQNILLLMILLGFLFLHLFVFDLVVVNKRSFDTPTIVVTVLIVAVVAVVVVVVVVVAVAVVAVVAFVAAVVAVVADVVTLVNPRPEGQICLVTLR